MDEAAKRNITVGFKHPFWEMGTDSDVGSALDELVESGQQVVLVAAVGVPEISLMLEAVYVHFASSLCGKFFFYFTYLLVFFSMSLELVDARACSTRTMSGWRSTRSQNPYSARTQP